MSNHKYRDRLLSCAALCGLLFLTYRQEMVLPEGAVQTEQTEETGAAEETEETEKTAAAMREKEVTDRAEEAEEEEEEGDNEALKLLIEDAGFRECVYDAVDIKKKDSKEEVLRKLENCWSLTLEEESCGIDSLEALSLFPNLRQLTIRIGERDDSVITDFTPISSLSRLEYLWISYEKDGEIDLSFLDQMPAITELFLTHCKIEDVSFLKQMPQLQCLSLYQTPVEDLAVLENLSNLVELALFGNENAKNMETVGKLTKMQDLGMQNCGIEDIGFLNGLTELRGVNLNGNRVTDITPLAGLDKLERLGLSENRIRDISALEGLHNLYDLAMDKNEIQDISALTQLSRLNQVGISDNQIEDLSPLAGKEELMYAAVFGNPVESLEPVWEVPLLLYADQGVTEEEEKVIADWLAEHYPEAEEFVCIDFIEGDLNGDGLQDMAFVADSEAFDVYEGEDFPERMPEERRLFILLQQEDGSWVEQADAPPLAPEMSGGMRGDPYRGIFMQEGYLLIKEGWGSSSGSNQTEIYEYRNGSLAPVRQIKVDDYNFAQGYDVEVQNKRTGTWQKYAIAMDGYRMVRVDLADSEHPRHKAFPGVSIYKRPHYIQKTKTDSRMTSEEALDLACEAVAEDEDLPVRENLPYAGWQKEGYELLAGATIPDYYYVMSGTIREADSVQTDWAGDYLYYDGMTKKEENLCHVIFLCREAEKSAHVLVEESIFLLDDATGEITEISYNELYYVN